METQEDLVAAAATANRGCDERRAERRQLSLSGMLTSLKFGSAVVNVIDLCSSGVKVQCDDRHLVGSLVTLSVPGIGTVDGWVAWRKPAEFGIEFANPLPLKVVEQTLLLA